MGYLVNRDYQIRPIKPQDNAPLQWIVRKVMKEFGVCDTSCETDGSEMKDFYITFTQSKSAYFVVTQQEKIFGGGGIIPLQPGDENTCELQKMYLLPEIRGIGLGQKLLEKCLQTAKECGYKSCYLETSRSMAQAQRLYVKNGFRLISNPMGKRGLSGCDQWYVKQL